MQRGRPPLIARRDSFWLLSAIFLISTCSLPLTALKSDIFACLTLAGLPTFVILENRLTALALPQHAARYTLSFRILMDRYILYTRRSVACLPLIHRPRCSKNNFFSLKISLVYIIAHSRAQEFCQTGIALRAEMRKKKKEEKKLKKKFLIRHYILTRPHCS